MENSSGKPVSHGLGVGHGSLIDNQDGSVEYRQTGKLLPAFKVLVRDVTGFSVRKASREDRKRLGASGMQQVLSVQGSGTTLAEVPVNHGTADKIEAWFRAHSEFGVNAKQPPGGPVDAFSVADELIKLAQLRDAGILTPDEFAVQKAKLLG